MNQKSISKNIFMNLLLTVSSYIFPLITYTYVARTILPDGTGRVAFANSIIGYFMIIATLGVDSYGIRQCAGVRDDREALSQTVQEIFTLNLISSGVAYVLLFIAVLAVPKFGGELPLYAILSLAIVLKALGMEWMYRAMEEYSYITIRSIIVRCIGVALTFLLVRERGDYVKYAVVTVVISSGSYVLNLIYSRKFVDFKRGRKLDLKRHVKPVFILFASAVTNTISSHFDITMLGFMKGDTEVGLYNCALRIKTMIVSVSTALSTTFTPRTAYYLRNGMMDDFRMIMKKSIRLSMALTVPLITYTLLNVKDVILFISGENYLGASPSLLVLTLCAYVLVLTNFFGYQLLVPMGKEKIYAKSLVFAMVINCILNLALIPRLGALGATIATLAAEVFNVVMMSSGVKEERAYIIKNVNYLPYLAGIAASVPSLLLVSRFVAGLGVFFRLAISASVYFAIYFGVLLAFREDTVAYGLKKALSLVSKLRKKG